MISGLPGDGVKFIAKPHSYCSNMKFTDKIRYERIFQQVTHKGGETAMNHIKIFHDGKGFVSFSGEKLLKGSIHVHISG